MKNIRFSLVTNHVCARRFSPSNQPQSRAAPSVPPPRVTLFQTTPPCLYSSLFQTSHYHHRDARWSYIIIIIIIIMISIIFIIKIYFTSDRRHVWIFALTPGLIFSSLWSIKDPGGYYQSSVLFFSRFQSSADKRGLSPYFPPTHSQSHFPPRHKPSRLWIWTGSWQRTQPTRGYIILVPHIIVNTNVDRNKHTDDYIHNLFIFF